MFHHSKKMRRLIAVFAVIGAAGIFAGCKHSPEERVDKISARVASHLDMNDAQKALLNDLTTEIKKDLREAKDDRQQKRKDFVSIILADDLDETKVKEMINDRQSKMDEKVQKYLPKIKALHKTLTADQKKQIVEFSEKMNRHWE